MIKDRRVWPREWRSANTDFVGERNEEGDFPGIDDKKRWKDENWPWETKDDDAAKDMYQALESSGCPFSWLF